MTTEQIRAKLGEIVALSGSQRVAAGKLGLSPAYLGELLRGTRKPGPRVLKALGLAKDTVYREESAT